MSDGGVEGLTSRIQAFAQAREWGQFHTPKNLAMALAGEVGELVAELQWLTEDQIRERLEDPAFAGRVGDEVADVLIYLLRLADVCGLDAVAEANQKIDRNERRYPVDLSRGSAAKYTDLHIPQAEASP